MKALVLNALGRGFEFEDVDIATPIGREVLVDVQASGLCHTDLLFATYDFVPMPAVLGISTRCGASPTTATARCRLQFPSSSSSLRIAPTWCCKTAEGVFTPPNLGGYPSAATA